MGSVQNALKGSLEFREIPYKTESKICLAWINVQTKEFKTIKFKTALTKLERWLILKIGITVRQLWTKHT